jgi:hypothetical protein
MDGIDLLLVPIGVEGKIAEDADCENQDHISP